MSDAALSSASRLAIEHRGGHGRVNFTGPQKAALIIAALGPEAAGPIIERIGDKHLKAFAESYARLQHVPRGDLISVVAEFLTHVSTEEDGGLTGGFEQARDLISRFRGPEEATKIFDTINVPGGRTVWQKLEAIADEEIAGYLARQSPQTAAVVLSRLNLDKSSAILAKLPDDLAQDVVTRLSKPAPIRPEALKALSNTIETEFLAPMRKVEKKEKPGETIGAMLNNMSEEKRNSFLAFIEKNKPEILADVKAAIMTFKDIPVRVPAKAVPQITREVDVPTLLKAVKFGRQNAPETVEFLFSNISQRLVQQYDEQINDMKPVPLAEAEAAQSQIMVAIRRLVGEGVFELNAIRSETDEESGDAPEEKFV